MSATLRQLFPAFLLSVGLYAQAPVITSIQNPASNILPGLPNFGIAQGQIFVLYGSNLGPTTLTQPSALPWPNLLSGTSIKVVGFGSSVVYNAPIVYTLNSQVAAVMPSGVPIGLGATVQLSYNGVVSNVFQTRITDTNFGISTVDSSGTGMAVITDGKYVVASTANSLVPGQTYTMWGTGLGAANSDNNIATNGDLGTNVQVFVGGVPASVTYRGRSSAPGLDQINFTIPVVGFSGCAISLIVQSTSTTTGTRVSNGPTIPIAANGGPCSDNNNIPTAAINAALSSKGSAGLAYVGIDGDQKQALAYFLRFSPSQWSTVKSGLFKVSPGSCSTSIQTGNGGSGGGAPASTPLDAGTALTLSAPGGAVVSMPAAQAGIYGGNISSANTGVYTLSNGSGGADVGKFSVNFNGPPAFFWGNSSTTTVTRSAGYKVTWAGGDANSYVTIQGGAGGYTVNNGNVNPTTSSANFVCQVPASTGQFTIPGSILLSIPSSPFAGSSNGSLQVNLSTYPQLITVPGTDTGVALTNTAVVTANVSYQ